jgi:CBS domain containing-hemolysin-like protein
LFDGKISINDVCKIINEESDVFDDVKGEADSLAGLLLEIKAVFPAQHEEINYKNFVFIIIQIDKRRIKKIKLIIKKKKNEM